MEILVLGCGVIGLCTAIHLKEKGHDAVIWGRELPPKTTSDIAAAFWYPYKAAPQEKVGPWGERTLRALTSLAKIPGSGVSLMSGFEVFRHPVDEPWWRPMVKEFRKLASYEIPPGYADGYFFEVPFVETPLYMPYLVERFRKLGGLIERRSVSSLDEALEACPQVVNCTGLGSREVVPDPESYPIRGQVIRLSRPQTSHFWLDEDHPEGIVYVFPRSRDCIVGGTAEEGNFSTTPDTATAKAMLNRAASLVPELRGCEILEHRVGLRPGRAAVRLEAETRGNGRVIHNYGHGGSGITLSWGCAENVAHLLDGR